MQAYTCISLSHYSFTITTTFNGYKKIVGYEQGRSKTLGGPGLMFFWGAMPCTPDFDVDLLLEDSICQGSAPPPDPALVPPPPPTPNIQSLLQKNEINANKNKHFSIT